MTTLNSILSQQIVQKLGWALIHFIWQAMVVALLLAFVLWLLRKSKANLRYTIACIALLLIVLLPIITMRLVPASERKISLGIEPTSSLPTAIPPARPEQDQRMVEAFVSMKPESSKTLIIARTVSYKQRFNEFFEPVLPYVVFVWLVGVFAFSIWHLGGWMQLQRLRRKMVKNVDTSLQDKLEELANNLGVNRVVLLLESALVQVPTVLGWLRPVILLPASALTGLSTEQLEAMLAHELAHIKRYDYLVNILQTVVEILGFYHPAVWWISNRIRIERENCCDDLAVSISGDRVRYARALTLMEEIRASRGELAIAASGGSLFARISRLVGKESTDNSRDGLIPSLIAILLVAALAISTTLPFTAWADSKTAGETSEGLTESLHQAAKEGDIEQVISLISKGADVNEKDKNGWTPLHTAAWYGRKDVAELLIAKGANVNAMDASGQTALHLAADFGTKFVSELLLAKGANVNARDKGGDTPLHSAARRWYVSKDLMELLTAKGADVNARNDQGQTPLHLTAPSAKAKHRSDVAVNFLLANGADINAKDKSGCTPLHVAAGNARKDIVELLLTKRATINEKTDDGITALHRAAMRGHKEIVELLLNKGADANAIQWSQWTALHYAAKDGNDVIIELLIAKGADVNAKNVRGETPAHLAAVQNHKDTFNLLISKKADVSSIQLAAYIGDLAKVKSFIERGVSVNAQDGYLLTPLHAAAATGQREVAEFLISKGAVVNADSVAEGPGTPLHYAADGGSKEVAELLISKGAIVNARNRDGEMPLHLSAKRGFKDLAKILIDRKAAVNARTQNGRTPLHYAAQNGHKDVVELLTDNGADVNVEAINKSKPLDFAAWSDHKDVVKLLIDKGTNISQVDDLFYCACMYDHRDLAELLIQKGANVNLEAWGEAPSLYAVWYNQPDILKLLLDHGANPNAKDRWDWSLLHYTSDWWHGSVDMTKMLLKKGVNPNVKTVNGITPLHNTVVAGHKEIADLLIGHGAEVNAKDKSYQTPLHYAVSNGRKDMAKFLIAKGANVNIKDKNDKTPMSLAKEKGYTEIVELLRKHGAKE